MSKISLLRLRIGLGISRFDIKKPTIEGLENLPSTPCVVATTHLSDIDVQEVVVAVANIRKVGMATQSTNLTHPLFEPFFKLMGMNNFFPITNTYNKWNTKYSLIFDDFKKMHNGIEQEERTIVISAHNPTQEWKLPEKPGVGAVILAHMTNVQIIPAAVDIQCPTPVAQTTDSLTRIKNFITMKRPKAKIYFCKPLQLSKIPNDKLIPVINLYNRDEREKMSKEEIASANKTLDGLKVEAEKLMLSLASKLPSSKRGKWSNFS